MLSGSHTFMTHGIRSLQASRVKEWIIHILLYVICGWLYGTTWFGQPGQFWPQFFIILALQVPGYLAFYLLNDVSDYHADIVRASPPARITNKPKPRYAILAFVVYGAAAVAVLNPAALSLALLTAIIALFYSLPPIRLKTRGVSGVFAAALFQRLPFFLILVFSLGRPNSTAMYLTAYLVLTGLLFIMYHQCEDFDDDRQSGTITWIVRRGLVFGYRFCRICSVVLTLLPLLAWTSYGTTHADGAIYLLFLIGFTALTIVTLVLFDIRYGRSTRRLLRKQTTAGIAT